MLESPDYFFRVREIGRLRQTNSDRPKLCACAELQNTKLMRIIICSYERVRNK